MSDRVAGWSARAGDGSARGSPQELRRQVWCASCIRRGAMSLRGRSVDELELELARSTIYRVNPNETTHSPSMVQLAGKFEASLAAIRETVQRFYALGLMRAVPSRGLILEPVLMCESADVLGLRMRAARNAEERGRALREYVQITQHVLASGLEASLGGDKRDIERMLERIKDLHRHLLFGTRAETSYSFFIMMFDAGYLSNLTALHWAASGLWRVRSAFAPWVTAAWEGRSDDLLWKAVRERYESADRAAISGAIAAALAPLSERIVRGACEEHPTMLRRPNDRSGY